MDNIEDDDMPVLSGSTLDALKEFYADRDAQQQRFEELRRKAEEQADAPLSMEAFAEDYSNETATLLAQELLHGADAETVIAVVSAPSVFVQVKNLLKEIEVEKRPKVHLLEFDRRFELFPEFTFYNYNDPLKLPPHLKGTVDRVVCDPPFLNEDCQTKVHSKGLSNEFYCYANYECEHWKWRKSEESS
ncbi:Protein-lysine N-methyltransferase efm5 [Clarireedia jacksonii]